MHNPNQTDQVKAQRLEISINQTKIYQHYLSILIELQKKKCSAIISFTKHRLKKKLDTKLIVKNACRLVDRYLDVIIEGSQSFDVNQTQKLREILAKRKIGEEFTFRDVINIISAIKKAKIKETPAQAQERAERAVQESKKKEMAALERPPSYNMVTPPATPPAGAAAGAATPEAAARAPAAAEAAARAPAAAEAAAAGSGQHPSLTPEFKTKIMFVQGFIRQIFDNLLANRREANDGVGIDELLSQIFIELEDDEQMKKYILTLAEAAQEYPLPIPTRTRRPPEKSELYILNLLTTLDYSEIGITSEQVRQGIMEFDLDEFSA